jgi:hypothetical protein
MVERIKTRARHAPQAGTHLQTMARGRRPPEHRVKGHYSENVRHRQAEQPRDVLERLVRKVTDLVLDEV